MSRIRIQIPKYVAYGQHAEAYRFNKSYHYMTGRYGSHPPLELNKLLKTPEAILQTVNGRLMALYPRVQVGA